MHILTLLIVMVFIYLTFGQRIDILENFAPRLRSRVYRSAVKRPVRHTAEILAKSFGFTCETHKVITDDGYIITLHRIRTQKSLHNNSSMPVALLYPGFLASSDSWLFRGSTKDLPYVFANSGYDMWISNPRGNIYSREHVRLDPDVDEEYWNFSFHEMGLYDLPASVDYILKITEQDSLFFTGHSMGVTACAIMNALKPEYNSKIKLITALGPAVTLSSENVNTMTKLMLSLVPIVEKYFKETKRFELFPQRKLNGRFAKSLCSDQSPTQKLCLSLIFVLVGMDYEQLNTTILPTAFTYYPAGTSLHTLTHTSLLYENGFVYLNKNTNEEKPKIYDLAKVTSPVVIFYGDGDNLVNKRDCATLAKHLPNVKGFYRVPHPSFNHLDFMWGTDAATLLYKNIIDLMNKHR